MEWYQNLLEVASEQYEFDINTFKTKEVSKFNDPEAEIYVFSKNGKEYTIDFWPVSLAQRRQTRAELEFIDYLAENKVSVARPLRTINGELFIETKLNGEDFIIMAFEMASGEFWNHNDPDKWNDRIFFNWGKLMGDMHRLTKDYKRSDKYNILDIFNRDYEGWGAYFDCLKVRPGIYKIIQELCDEFMTYPRDRDSYGLIHNDLHPWNFHIDGDKLTLFDFNDNIYGWFAMDVGIALYHGLDWSRKNDAGYDFTNAIIENFLKGYLSANHLSDFWLSKIPKFMKYRQICFNLGDITENHEKWKYKIENDILFDGIDLKSISDIIENISSFKIQYNHRDIICRILSKEELKKFEQIDRYEIVEDIYYFRDGRLVLEKEYYEIKGLDNIENRIKNLKNIYDGGGTIYGAFHNDTFVGLVSLKDKLIGKNNDTIQLCSCFVSKNYRKRGIAAKLVSMLKEKAKELGGQKMYVSATPSKNTVHFYMSVGFKVTDEPIKELFDEEPEDIHMECVL